MDACEAITTVVQDDDDSNKKMPAVSIPAKKDTTQHDTAFLPNTSQGGANTSNQQDDGTGNDGCGQPWIPGLFDPSHMLLPVQSAIMFSPQVASQDGAPTHNSEEEEELQNDILVCG